MRLATVARTGRPLRSHDTRRRSDGAAADLGDDRYVVGPRLVEQSEHLAPHIGVLVGLVEVDAHGDTCAFGHLNHPWPFIRGQNFVFGSELENT
jgi:hypothetical protein